MSSKWNPFNAVLAGTEMVEKVMDEKNICEMPILSDDQLKQIEEKILNSFNNQSVIKMKILKGIKYYEIEGIVSNIDIYQRKLVLNSNISVYFSQIIEIY